MKEEYMQRIDKWLNSSGPIPLQFQNLEKKLKVPKMSLFLGSVFILLLAIIFLNGVNFLTLIVGFFYPVYNSFKAIESTSKDDDVRWLMYWVVFSTFHVLEFFSDILLFWFPFYYTLKLVLLLWCMAPMKQNGAAVIYEVIRGHLKRQELTIDATVEDFKGKAKTVITNASGALNDSLNSALQEAMEHNKSA